MQCQTTLHSRIKMSVVDAMQVKPCTSPAECQMLKGKAVQICLRDDSREVPYARKQWARHRIAVADDGTFVSSAT